MPLLQWLRKMRATSDYSTIIHQFYATERDYASIHFIKATTVSIHITSSLYKYTYNFITLSWHSCAISLEFCFFHFYESDVFCCCDKSTYDFPHKSYTNEVLNDPKDGTNFSRSFRRKYLCSTCKAETNQ